MTKTESKLLKTKTRAAKIKVELLEKKLLETKSALRTARDDLQFLLDGEVTVVRTDPEIPIRKMRPGIELYNADPNCEHEYDNRWSGIGCSKCQGWYCL